MASTEPPAEKRSALVVLRKGELNDGAVGGCAFEIDDEAVVVDGRIPGPVGGQHLGCRRAVSDSDNSGFGIAVASVVDDHGFLTQTIGATPRAKQDRPIAAAGAQVDGWPLAGPFGEPSDATRLARLHDVSTDVGASQACASARKRDEMLT